MIRTQCCIAGGGPAGMMLGVLLARAGVDVVVLEKHADFLRDFRGDTVHPSTLDVIAELGWLEEFLRRPHQEVRELGGYVGDERVLVADFSALPTRCPFLVLMPQWDFLDFLAGHGRAYPTFHLRMESEVVDLLRANRRVTGVLARTPEGPLEVQADLTVGADGRHSAVRERAGLRALKLAVPIDVLWMRLSRRADDPESTFGYVRAGHVLVMLDRGDYWQCALVIRKGGYGELRGQGLDVLRQRIADIAPFLRDRVGELADWDAVQPLTVQIDRLRRWFDPGLLCIGDCAHAMSPIGGVGINLAIQDAVAAANRLAGPLREGRVSLTDLAAVQMRRDLATRVTQRLQALIQNRVIQRVLSGALPARLPLPVRLLRDHPSLRRLPAHAVGVGIQPEHVHTAEARAGAVSRRAG
jgi:2-polyprenyl-6-methoxyphenol hydroxylase-like FAD-dependent oxidoreductase